MKSSHKLLRLLVVLSAIKVLAETQEASLALDLPARTLFGVKQEEISWMYLDALNIQVLLPNETNATRFIHAHSLIRKAVNVNSSSHHGSVASETLPAQVLPQGTACHADDKQPGKAESVHSLKSSQHSDELPHPHRLPEVGQIHSLHPAVSTAINAVDVSEAGGFCSPQAPTDLSDETDEEVSLTSLPVLQVGATLTGINLVGQNQNAAPSVTSAMANLLSAATSEDDSDEESVVISDSRSGPSSSARVVAISGKPPRLGVDYPDTGSPMSAAASAGLQKVPSEVSSVHTVPRHLRNTGANGTAPQVPHVQRPVSPVKAALSPEIDDEITRLAKAKLEAQNAVLGAAAVGSTDAASSAQHLTSVPIIETLDPAASAGLHPSEGHDATAPVNELAVLHPQGTSTASTSGQSLDPAELGRLLGMGALEDETTVTATLAPQAAVHVDHVEHSSASSTAGITHTDDLAKRLGQMQHDHAIDRAIDASLTTMQLDEVRRVLPTLYDQLTGQKRQVVSEFFESPLGKIALETPDCIHVAVVQLEQPTTPWGIESLIRMVLANLHAPTDVQGYNYTISLADQMREKKLDHSCIEKFEKELADCSSAVTETDLPLLNKVLLYRARVKHVIAKTLQQHFVSGDYEQLWQAALAVNRNECYKSTAKVTHTVVKEFFSHVTDVLYAHVLNGALPFMDVLNQLRGCIQNSHTNGYKLNTEMIEQAQQDPMAKTNQLDFVGQYSSILMKHTDAQLEPLVKQMFSSSDSKALCNACFQDKGFRRQSMDLADDYIKSALAIFASRAALLGKFHVKPSNIDDMHHSLHASAKYFISNFIALISIYDYMLVVQDICSSELAQLVFEKAQMLYAKDPSKMLAHYMDQIFGNLRRKQQHVDVGQLPAVLDAWKAQIAEITTAEALVEYLQNETMPLFLDPVKAVSASSRELLELKTPEVIKPALQAVLSCEYIAALSPAQLDAWNKFATFDCFESFLEMPEYLRSAAEKLSSKPGWGYDDLLSACIAEMYVDSKTKIEADITVEQYLKGVVNVDAELLTAFGMEWVGFEQAINSSSLTAAAKTNLFGNFKSALAFKLKQKRSILSHIASIEGATVAQVWKIALERNKKANLRHDVAGFIAAIKYAKVAISQLQNQVKIFAQLAHFKTLAENSAKSYDANDALCEYKKSHSVSSANVEQLTRLLQTISSFIDEKQALIPLKVSENLTFETSEDFLADFKEYVSSLNFPVSEEQAIDSLCGLLWNFFGTVTENVVKGVKSLDSADQKECLNEIRSFLSRIAVYAVKLALIRDFADAVAGNNHFSADQMEVLKAKALIVMRNKLEAPGSYLRMAYGVIEKRTAGMQPLQKTESVAAWIASLGSNPANLYNIFKGKSLKPARYSPQDGSASVTRSPADSLRQSPVDASSGRSSSSDSADSNAAVQSKRGVKFVDEAVVSRVSPVASIMRASPTPLDEAGKRALDATIAVLTKALQEGYYAGADFSSVLIESAVCRMQRSFASEADFASLTAIQLHCMAATKIAATKLLPNEDLSNLSWEDWKELARIDQVNIAKVQIWWASKVESEHLKAAVLAKLKK